MLPKKIFLNTSNRGKFDEFKRVFADKGIELEATNRDIKEIQANPISVVVHKASQLGLNILVEDTCLTIEDSEVGINIRWLIDKLPDYVGKKALFSVYLAIMNQNKKVEVYLGQTSGKIVEKRGEQGFGFDPFFLPDGQDKTFAELKPDQLNPRVLALESFFTEKVHSYHDPILNWDGPYQ